jgi:hypothetical protein
MRRDKRTVANGINNNFLSVFFSFFYFLYIVALLFLLSSSLTFFKFPLLRFLFASSRNYYCRPFAVPFVKESK